MANRKPPTDGEGRIADADFEWLKQKFAEEGDPLE
jgi:hypothetical protein